ncbi:MAG: sigma-70 family RNA polymerase sigma factor [Bdellovibrionota bacterium]
MSSNSQKDQNSRWASLMAKAQTGDNEAYSLLLREIRKILQAFVSSRIHDKNAVEDVVQEILLGIHNAKHTYDSSKAFTPWMYTIAKYKYIDHIRKWTRKEKNIISDEGILDQIISIKEDNIESNLKDELRVAIQKLPDKQKIAVQLMKLEGLSVKEVSQRTGMSETSVKVTAHRGYKALKKLLMDIKA